MADTILPKVWITKYALTQGVITAVNVRVLSDHPNLIGIEQDGFPRWTYFHKPDWHETETEAGNRVMHMVNARLKSLDKQRTKLEQLRAQASICIFPLTAWKQRT